MSRVAKVPVAVPAGVGVAIANGAITVKGPLGTLTQVINPQAFHWRMSLHIPWPALLAGAGSTLVAAVLASHYAARQATRLPVAQVLASAQ